MIDTPFGHKYVLHSNIKQSLLPIFSPEKISAHDADGRFQQPAGVALANLAREETGQVVLYPE
jgi:hypothetical protein